jgi:hypothetical protein
MRRTDDLMLNLSRVFGDLTDPKNAISRAAFDMVNKELSRRTIDYAEPTGPGVVRGEPEYYDGFIPAGSNAEFHAHVEGMNKLLRRQPDEQAADTEKRHASLKQVAATRGYLKSRAVVDAPRLKYLEGSPNYMTGVDFRGDEYSNPALGGGEILQSKYAHLNPDEAPKPTFDSESRFDAVPDAPRLPNGEIDWEAVNRYHNSPQPDGRQAHSYVKIGSK